jgi:hypothetical protein
LKKKSTNSKKQPIELVMAAAIITSFLVAMTILTPTHASALSKFTTNNTDTSSLKQAVRDGVTVNLQHRDQHMDQENLCYRANTCRQSNAGQNTLGNDNSVTGFADQSDNIQQSAAPTTANQTIPTPTPTPTPPTATLTVTKIVSGNTTAIPAQFAIHVTGNNPKPPNFAGSTTGIDVTLGSGAFNVTETVPTGSFFTSSFIGDCAGSIAAGQHLSCTIINTPKTCEECFTSILNSTQITTILDVFDVSPAEGGLTALCGILSTISETNFRAALLDRIDVTTIDELIACLKAAGIVFAP